MARKTKEEANRTRKQIIDAARAVFHRNGVARSSLEQVAIEAGVTRGAVYWHFKNKAELFFAMRADAFVPLQERVDALLLSDDYADPLDAIEDSLKAFFRILDDCPTVRQVLEIMTLRCENVDEFAEVQIEAERPGAEFLAKVETVYKKAAERGVLRPEGGPSGLALDTWAFTNGLLHGLLTKGFDRTLPSQVDAMITAHMNLRRLA